MKKVKLIFLTLILCLCCLCGCVNTDNEALQKQIEELQKQNAEMSNKLNEMEQQSVGVTMPPTLTATSVPTATLAPTSTPSPTPTSTPSPTPTSTPSPTPTSTPSPTPTNTPTPTPTNTPTPTPTNTPTPAIDYAKILEEYKNDVDVEYDKVDNDYAIKPKNIAQNDNVTSVIQISDDGEITFGAQFGFIAYDWVFTEKIKIACEDTTHIFEVDYYSMLSTEVLSGGKISENAIFVHKPEYSSISDFCIDFEPVIKSIKNSKEVILRFSGDGYEDFTLSEKDKNNLIMMWDIYCALLYDSNSINYLV